MREVFGYVLVVVITAITSRLIMGGYKAWLKK